MRFKYIFLVLVLFSLLYACGKEGGGSSADPQEIITSRTLGLAYLEENKLEDAEIEFLNLTKLAPKEALGYANLGLVYLRMDRPDEAEAQLKKAIEISKDDPDIRLILAKVYDVNDQKEKAVDELEKTLEFAPDHAKSLYSLAEIYAKSTEETSADMREKYLRTLVEKSPGNIVPFLQLTEVLIDKGETDEALALLEEIITWFPDLPAEAVSFYDKSIASLQASNAEEARTSVLIFHNFLKLNSLYQSSVAELKGPGGPLIGFPILTFGQPISIPMQEGGTLLEAMQFTDVTESSKLDVVQNQTTKGKKYNSTLATADYDGDGDFDLYVGFHTEEGETFHFLLNNEIGRFSEVSDEMGIRHSAKGVASTFADYDNDGHLDLFISGEEENILYKNTGDGDFEDATDNSGLKNIGLAKKALFFDMDHEGDLDLLGVGGDKNHFFRNNGDETFDDVAQQAGLKMETLSGQDAVFGDFDDDGDVDFLITNPETGIQLYSNVREGKFEDLTDQSGLIDTKGLTKVTTGDYNNDGYLDLFLTAENSEPTLFRNSGEGTFIKDTRSAKTFSSLKTVQANEVAFFDFDNDGYLDLLIVGKSSTPGKKGVVLFHNDGSGIFSDESQILPDDVLSGQKVALADYNEDGDIDIFLTDSDGNFRLLRNDGGNVNHFLKIQLVGLRTGSGKNNHFGIGAKLEVRAGELYQMKIVDEPYIHFGLGEKEDVDVVRVLWTNGVPQNLFSPKSDQDLIEEQELKGSCPFIYTWNGEEYEFVKDVMWRSALGMPLGIMGGTTAYAFGDASDDYIKIPGESLKEKDGKYSIQLTAELWETIYFDQVQLVAVDHPNTVEIFVDETFSPPPFPEYRIYEVENKVLPASVTDGAGNDLLNSVLEKDDSYISNFKKMDFQGIIEEKELVIDPGELTSQDDLHLFLQGWIFPTDASINVAISQSKETKVVSPYLQVINKKGQWETVIENLGFPMGKDKTMIVDLSDKYLSNDYQIRIVTNMEIYWDHIFFSNVASENTSQSNTLNPDVADLHYRGFSKMYRKGGRYGPHWFDYYEVSKGQKWRDLEGNYTRFGDVEPLLQEADDQYIIANAGDETTLEFDATQLPDLQEGWTRDFLIHTVGWVKDGDMNTAFGNAVEPLPFHGMTKYPYGEEEQYPSDLEHENYTKTYNTREIRTENFQRTIFDSNL